MAEKVRYIRSLWGTGGPTVMRVTIGASQSIAKGDLIGVDGTSGNCIEVNAAADNIIGIALGAATTAVDGSAEMDVIALDSRSVIRLKNYTGSTVDDATSAMCWGKDLYDMRTDGTLDFNDTTSGYLIPVAPSVDGYTDCVISAAKLWNA